MSAPTTINPPDLRGVHFAVEQQIDGVWITIVNEDGSFAKFNDVSDAKAFITHRKLVNEVGKPIPLRATCRSIHAGRQSSWEYNLASL